MKRQLSLMIGIVGSMALMDFPAVAKTNGIEDSLNSVRTNHQTVSGSLNRIGITASSRTAQKLAEAPPSVSGNLVEKAAKSAQFQILFLAINVTGLTEILATDGSYTVFAPTDQAFAKLPPRTLEKLLKPENKDLLLQVLGYHVVPGEVTTSQLQPGQIETISGKALAVRVNPTGQVILDRAKLIQPDIQASNGVIHAIDRVILPPQLLAQIDAAPSQTPSREY